jgi:hypothetical protein
MADNIVTYKVQVDVASGKVAIDGLTKGFVKAETAAKSLIGTTKKLNKGLDIKSGKKYDKVIQNGSVWGFIAKTDGVHKGIPHKKGDVFKAAGWRAPAKWARGSIYDLNQTWFRWTGPDYLI